MNDIPWRHEASLVRRTPAGEEEVGRGIVHQLVGAFLEMAPDRQEELTMRVTGPDWAAEYDAARIRELAAHPDHTGAAGRWDTEKRSGDAEETEPGRGTTVEEGATGPAPRL